MLQITDVLERTNENGQKFTLLVVCGNLELVKSSTGKWYGTIRKTTIPCTLDLALAKQTIGTKIKGSIIKVESEPYSYKTSNGEEIELNFKYQYSEEVGTMEEAVFN